MVSRASDLSIMKPFRICCAQKRWKFAHCNWKDGGAPTILEQLFATDEQSLRGHLHVLLCQCKDVPLIIQWGHEFMILFSCLPPLPMKSESSCLSVFLFLSDVPPVLEEQVVWSSQSPANHFK